MARAAVFIGVDRTGDLPALSDAAAGAERLHEEWGAHQQLGPSILLTDREKPVTADDVQSAITKVLEPGNLDQLVVYFAGHGVNVRMGEYWLLSDAPKKTQAAVNVRGSEHLARYCGVPHVVFISDTCRTAADTISAQNVTGTDIFPNDQQTVAELPVDLFYACALGKPSHEARDVHATSGAYKGIYTEVLRAALCFEAEDAAEWIVENGAKIGYIRPRRLRDFLKMALPAYIHTLGQTWTIAQTPDAHISSDPGAWLSRTEVHGAKAAGTPRFNLHPDLDVGANLARSLEKGGDLRTARALVSAAIADPDQVSAAIGTTDAPRPLALVANCGFEIHGAIIREAFARDARLERLPGEADVNIRADFRRLYGSPWSGDLALLVMEGGRGVVLPIMREFIATLTFEEGELVDVAYEPAAKTSRARAYRGKTKRLRTLRKVISQATLLGQFRLDGDEVWTLARGMQAMKGYDPTLGLYASYAYHDLHLRDDIKYLDRQMLKDLGGSLFDIAMHAGRLDHKHLQDMYHIIGFCPLLAQGWAYLRARGIRLPEGCEDLDTMLVESLWTMFTPQGVALLRSTLFRGAEPWRAV